MTPLSRISAPSIRRFSSYLHALDHLERLERQVVSSRELGAAAGIPPAQVRKDLSYLGGIGKRGLGYRVEALRRELRAQLGLSRDWPLAVVGAGEVGSALLASEDLPRQGFLVVAVFDSTPDRVGQTLGSHRVQPITLFPEVCREREVEIGVIATPAEEAQQVADLMALAGLRAVLNFAAREVVLPEHVAVRAVNMARELESLSFSLTHLGVTGRRGTNPF